MADAIENYFADGRNGHRIEIQSGRYILGIVGEGVGLKLPKCTQEESTEGPSKLIECAQLEN